MVEYKGYLSRMIDSLKVICMIFVFFQKDFEFKTKGKLTL